YTFYFPIDLPSCVRRAVDHVDPAMVIIAETEIWPNFLRACRTHEAQVVMINGRISDKSFARYRLARRWLRRVFEDYTIIGMQSEMDRLRIEAIGADPQKVTVFGNLKYDEIASSRPLDTALASLLASWNQIWIAASTIRKLLSSPEQALELGSNAFAIVQQNTGATDRVLQVLEPVEAGR